MTLEAIPADGSDDSPNWRRIIGEMVNKLLIGGGDNVGTVSTATGAAVTTISDLRIGVSSKIILVPESAGAASMVYDGVTAVKVLQSGVAEITHTAVSATSISISYAIVGS